MPMPSMQYCPLKGMKMSTNETLKKPYARVLVPDSTGGFFAELLEFPGCFAEGETSSEAYEQLEKAAESWIEAALELGQEIPEPLSSHDYSGKLALRLPKSLHKKATFFAQQDGVSLNQYIICAIAEKIGEARASTNVLATYTQPMFSAGAGFIIGTGTNYGIGISSAIQSTAGNASVITSPNAAVIAPEVVGRPKLQVIR